MRKTKRAIYFNGEYNQFNTGVGLQCITYDPANGFQFVDGDKVISIATDTDKAQNVELSGLTNSIEEIKTGFTNFKKANNNKIKELSGNIYNITEKLNLLTDYSAFEVMPTTEIIPAGTISDISYETNKKDNKGKPIVATCTYKFDVPACTIHKMTIRSAHKNEDCDVIIDWGDGTIETIKENKEKYPWNGKGYDVEHDYAEALTNLKVSSAKFIVKIYGKNYYTFRHNNSIETIKDKYSIESIVETSYNLISRIFDVDLPIASHISNFASMCYGALRLLKVNIPHSSSYITRGFNFSSLFQYCSNIESVKGFEDSPITCGGLVGNIFAYCKNLVTTDFIIPTSTTTMNYLFYYCENLTNDIAKLIPANGFALDNINCNLAFSRTWNLTGTVPAKLLWESNKTFVNCLTAFRDSSLADDESQNIPNAWKGITE